MSRSLAALVPWGVMCGCLRLLESTWPLPTGDATLMLQPLLKYSECG